MVGRKGFTLIELMVVILIVAILAAVAIPIMRGRVDSAKWSEGRAIIGTIATAVRAFCAEKDKSPGDGTPWADLGFRAQDLRGTYFSEDMFNIDAVEYDPNAIGDVYTLTFDISATNPALRPKTVSLDETGAWTETFE